MSGRFGRKADVPERSPTWHCQASISKNGILGAAFSGARYMLNKDKRNYISWGLTALVVITASLLVAFLINRFSAVQAFFSFIVRILKPVIYGAIMTFLTAPLFNRMAVRLDRLFNHGKTRKEPGSLARAISTAACAFMIIAIITAALALLVPSIISSVTDIINRLSQFTGSVEDFLNMLFPPACSCNSIFLFYH